MTRPKRDTETADFFNAAWPRRVPNIQTAPPIAPGSESSRAGSEKVGPFRRQSWRRILLTLASLPPGRCLTREEIAERIQAKEGPLCARLSELRPLWVEAVPGACTSTAGVQVDGYRLTEAGKNVVAECP